MSESPHLSKVRARLKGVKGRTLAMDERKELAIEIAGFMMSEARRIQSTKEHAQQSELAAMMHAPYGKAFVTSVADQCFRSSRRERVASQVQYLLDKFGVPRFFSLSKRTALYLFKWWGAKLPAFFVPLTQKMVRRESRNVIIPGEKGPLRRHLHRRRKEHVRVNLNHLGEAILGEEEAQRRLNVYIKDLENPAIEYVSIKISTIFSQIHLLAWEETLEILAERLRLLYRAARDHKFKRADKTEVFKFVNLDMEEYRDLYLTVALFRKVLDEPEFFHLSAGIVLQSYLPDSFLLQQELTVWAMQRVATGGAPIKIRLVKGANLMMEQFESAVKGWPQAPYDNKSDVDANFKRMIIYGCQPDHAQAVHLGIGSHNLFDIAFTLVLCVENQIEKYVQFEMLEGMADALRRVVEDLSGGMLLYCPVSKEKDFSNALAYLVRRLDENTAPENFLRAAFDLIPGSQAWQKQASLFSIACHASHSVSYILRRQQNRLLEVSRPDFDASFENEPDTDWALPHNRRWIDALLKKEEAKEVFEIPIVVGGREIQTESREKGIDPSRPQHEIYTYSLAEEKEVETALTTAKKAEKRWSATPIEERSHKLADVAQKFREARGDLIGVMVADGGKVIAEADSEVSEAIDFLEYYRRSVVKWHALEDLEWSGRGTVVVTPPWNFPCAIPVGGMAAALATGNVVILKPAREVIAVAWKLVNLFWEGGIPKEVLQFVVCEDEPYGSQLVSDERVDAVVLTGGTDTAKKLKQLRPGMHLLAETGGKNALIVTSMADRDLAVHSTVLSAFGHAGQKCSACSLLILEKEVYDDPDFRRQLRDATLSLKVGSAWDRSTVVNPLITPPGSKLMRGLTSLEADELWLVEPKPAVDNPHIWSPGIKWGVKPGSDAHQTEYFGPVLSVVCAEDLDDAIDIANETPYGLTGGIESLDEREVEKWEQEIEVGNAYVNRTTTGAIVERQPFGGCKESAFGPGAKAGGPNYLVSLMRVKQKELPESSGELNKRLNELDKEVRKSLDRKEKEIWNASLKSYSAQWKKVFSRDYDFVKLQGQDNILRYLPRTDLVLRIQNGDAPIDIWRALAAAQICKVPLRVSSDEKMDLKGCTEMISIQENESEFCERVSRGDVKRVRFLQAPSDTLLKACSQGACQVIAEPVLANGRVELLHFLREMSISSDYHRYGNLGPREDEIRKPLPIGKPHAHEGTTTSSK